MKANKIIRKLVEESFQQVETTNRLLVQAEERVERIHAQHRREIEIKNRRIRDLEKQLKELKNELDLNRLRMKLSGE